MRQIEELKKDQTEENKYDSFQVTMDQATKKPIVNRIKVEDIPKINSRFGRDRNDEQGQPTLII